MLALSRVQVHNPALVRQIIDAAGSAKDLFDNLPYVNDFLPNISPALVEELKSPAIMERAKREMDFISSNGIKLTCIGDDNYPARLFECCDAPIALYSLGNIPFNARRIVSIVGTRHASEYGKECEMSGIDSDQGIYFDDGFIWNRRCKRCQRFW